MIAPDFDINEFYEKGYVCSQLDSALADRILEEMSNELWVRVVPDTGVTDSLATEKGYVSRYIAAHSVLSPASLRPTYREYEDAFRHWAGSLIKQYDTAENAMTSALFGSMGYYMDMHTDAGDQCPFTVILYLGSDLDGSSDVGGNLNIYDVDVDNPEENPSHRASIQPIHGRIVVFNNIDPSVYHSVDPLSKNVIRYQLLSSFGMSGEQEWNYNIPHDTGAEGRVINPYYADGSGFNLCIDDHHKMISLIYSLRQKNCSHLPFPKAIND